METQFILRPATTDDIPALDALITESFLSLGRAYYSEREIAAGLDSVIGVDRELIDDSTYYVVLAEDTPVACGGWSMRQRQYGSHKYAPGDTSDRLQPGVDPALLRAFFVHPDWTRRGIASRLCRHCETEARKRGFLELALLATLSGEPLYRALGFKPEKRLDVECADGSLIAGVTMKKAIDAQ